jgi:prepilin-type N-terminal cleavage/methylation domain-containing protein
MKISLFKKGFTLIELLVVIAIIGILTAIVTANFTTAKSKARDAKRVSDIAQLQLVLEQAFDKCSVYPPDINNTNTVILNSCTKSGGETYTLYDFISVIPADPKTNTGYSYVPGSSNLDYVLRAVFENPISSSLDSVDSSSLLTLDCTKSNKNYCVQPK